MKIIITIITLMLFVHSKAQNEYYYYRNAKMVFTIDTSSIFIESHTVMDSNSLKDLLGSNIAIKKFGVISKIPPMTNLPDKKASVFSPMSIAVISLNRNLSGPNYISYLRNVESNSGIDYVSPGLITERGTRSTFSDMFYVKIKNNGDIALLNAAAEKTGTTVLGRSRSLPLWYILKCTKNSMGNALDMAKYFYETGNFNTAEPDFMDASDLACQSGPNADPDFGQQWYLNNQGNTGSRAWANGYDIGACAAWDITTGSPKIIIGNVDESITPNHPDFPAGIILANVAVTPPSASNPITNNQVDFYGNYSSHSTECVGIMVAQQDNGIGISGIAPDCGIMSVTLDQSTGFGTTMQFADGISFAWGDPNINNTSNKCDVINCSWETSNSTMVDDAIQNAMTNGRNGLGTVVVFASGTDGSGHPDVPLSYPASDANNGGVFADILTVGAMCQSCEEKQWWDFIRHNRQYTSCVDGQDWTSCSGNGLDLVAPGVNIYTTTNQTSSSPSTGSYFAESGTSYAAPQVSAVAALILSLYPCLTEFQVGEFIDQSATKVGSYTYSPATSTTPFGTWNSSDVGYGMLNANNALLTVLDMNFLQDEDVTDAQKRFSLTSIMAGFDVTSRKSMGYFTLNNTANIEIKATQSITFEPGFVTVPGAVMNAHIEAFTGNNCTDWTPVFNKKNPGDIINNTTSTDSGTNITSIGSIKAGINMYPNPFGSSLTVAFDVLTNNENISIKVYDLTGRLIYQMATIAPLGMQDYTIPVNANPSLYMVEACMGGDCKTQKMVKHEMD